MSALGFGWRGAKGRLGAEVTPPSPSAADAGGRGGVVPPQWDPKLPASSSATPPPPEKPKPADRCDTVKGCDCGGCCKVCDSCNGGCGACRK